MFAHMALQNLTGERSSVPLGRVLQPREASDLVISLGDPVTLIMDAGLCQATSVENLPFLGLHFLSAIPVRVDLILGSKPSEFSWSNQRKSAATEN